MTTSWGSERGNMNKIICSYSRTTHMIHIKKNSNTLFYECDPYVTSPSGIRQDIVPLGQEVVTPLASGSFFFVYF